MHLGELRPRVPARIVGFAKGADASERATILSIQEMGLTVGARLVIKHTGPFGGTPLAVECRGALVGIGKQEAALVLIETETAP